MALDFEIVLPRLKGAPHGRKFIDAWRQWRGGKVLPSRSEADPALLRVTMAAVTILQVNSPDEIVYRMTGSEMDRFTGRRRAGQNIVDLAPPQQRDERILRHQNIVCVPCGAWLLRRSVNENGLVGELESVLLPVANDKDSERPFIYFSCDVRRPKNIEFSNPPAGLELARDFEYIDIGAGVPAG